MQKLDFLPSYHAIVDGEDDQDDGEDGQVPRHLARVPGRHKVVDEDAGDAVDLVGGADEDEGGDEQVEHGVVRHEDEDPCGLRKEQGSEREALWENDCGKEIQCDPSGCSLAFFDIKAKVAL